MNIFQLIKMLDDGQVDYVVVGGLAVALHGYHRLTLDVDVVLAMSEDNLRRFIACARRNGLQPTIPVPIESLANPELIETWYVEKGMLAFSLRAKDAYATVIDVLVRPVVPFEELRRDASRVAVGTLNVPIASIDHLIVMKSGTGRAKDVLDIEELRKIQAGRLA